MVAYSFKQQFIEPIQARTKRQTIRADRRRHALVGEDVQLYYGMRTKQCRKILEARCIRVEPIRMVFGGYPGVQLGEIILHSQASLDEFARSDGFASWAEMEAFWHIEHKDVLTGFQGVLIGWA